MSEKEKLMFMGEYGNMMMKSTESYGIIDFLTNRKEFINRVYASPGAYDSFVLNTKVRFLQDWEPEYDSIKEQVFNLLTVKNFTSNSAIVYNFLKFKRHTLTSEERLQLENYLLRYVNRFTFMYFMETISEKLNVTDDPKKYEDKFHKKMKQILFKILDTGTVYTRHNMFQYFVDYRSGKVSGAGCFNSVMDLLVSDFNQWLKDHNIPVRRF